MANQTKKKWKPALLFLLLPLIALFWPPFYDFQQPTLAGIPFFYWSQLLWVIVTAAITAGVYLMDA